MNGHKDIVKTLLANKAMISSQTENGWIPIHYACAMGHNAVAKILIKAGAKTSAQNKKGETPLFNEPSGLHRWYNLGAVCNEAAAET